jgi:flagellar motor component MotA
MVFTAYPMEIVGTNGLQLQYVYLSLLPTALFDVSQAVGVVSIQVQLLTSSSIASSLVPRILLTISLMFELIGVMLIIHLTRFRSHHTSFQKIIRAASELPTFLILTGIIGVAAALAVEMFDISLGTAIAMSVVLILGVVFCFVVWGLGIGERAAVWDHT